ncbi:hypothetical protein ACQP0U_13895 [Micromonospora sp. CA-269861]|uniref:hypothetical protein n=1 Tax=Micromonospora sp. CA-269861 TaxID=3239968 RepID=UPI003D90944E
MADAGFSELRPLQFAGVLAPEVGNLDAERLASEIVSEFPPATESKSSPDKMRRWIDRITHFLGQVGDEKRLDDCAVELGVQQPDLHLVRLPEGKRFLAHQLLDEGLNRRTYRAIRAVSDFMEREWLDKLVRDVSFTWVSSEAAIGLLEFGDVGEGLLVVLNARSPFTADEYLDRATCRGGYWREVAGIAIGEDAVTELVNHYENAVASLHGIEEPWTLDDIQPRDEPSFLVVDPAGVRLDSVLSALRIIRDRYPWVVVILLVGTITPHEDLLSEWGSEHIKFLTPQLQPGEEQSARRSVRDLRSLLQR